MADCPHGMEEPAWCSTCAAPPAGVKPWVNITKGGQYFHNDPNCPQLEHYQAVAAAEGNNVHPRTRVAWGDIQHDRSPCATCVGRIV